MTVSLLEAKANLEEPLLKAAAGESVVIALEHQQFEVTLKKKLRGGLGSLPGWNMSDDIQCAARRYERVHGMKLLLSTQKLVL